MIVHNATLVLVRDYNVHRKIWGQDVPTKKI